MATGEQRKFGMGEVLASSYQWIGGSGLGAVFGFSIAAEGTRASVFRGVRHILPSESVFNVFTHATSIGASLVAAGVIAPTLDALHRRYLSGRSIQDTDPTRAVRRVATIGIAAALVVNAILETKTGSRLWPYPTNPEPVDFGYGVVSGLAAATLLPRGEQISGEIALINEARGTAMLNTPPEAR